MDIISFQFLMFVAVTAIIYFILPKNWQWTILFIANILFYAASGLPYLIYIVVASLVSFLMALRIEQAAADGKERLATAENMAQKKEIRAKTTADKKRYMAIAVVIALGIWIVLKYTNFFLRNVNTILGLFHVKPVGLMTWILPLGISYYTFHCVGYVVDIYRSKYAAEKNYAKFFTFVAYFPHVIQGPFSRFDDLGVKLFEEHRFSYQRLCEGCSRILWGVFKKTIVADKIGVAPETLFADAAAYSGTQAFIVMMIQGIRLYADFSGYMDIVCGISHIFGIELQENFKQPYFAKTIDEFWRRWHFTLGDWFKDYLFYPISFGKTAQKIGKKARKKWGPKTGKLAPGYYAMIFVWTATGLWHGANWAFVIWGWLNLAVILTTMQFGDTYAAIRAKLHINDKSIPWQIFCVIRTYCILCCLRMLSETGSFEIAATMVHQIFTDLRPGMLLHPTSWFVGMGKKEIAVSLLGAVMIFGVDLMNELEYWPKIKEKSPVIIRNLMYAGMIMIIILTAGRGTDLSGGFMYAVF